MVDSRHRRPRDMVGLPDLAKQFFYRDGTFL
jgi:hypothetical protein